jgi:hypothetical protein
MFLVPISCSKAFGTCSMALKHEVLVARLWLACSVFCQSCDAGLSRKLCDIVLIVNYII